MLDNESVLSTMFDKEKLSLSVITVHNLSFLSKLLETPGVQKRLVWFLHQSGSLPNYQSATSIETALLRIYNLQWPITCCWSGWSMGIMHVRSLGSVWHCRSCTSTEAAWITVWYCWEKLGLDQIILNEQDVYRYLPCSKVHHVLHSQLVHGSTLT